MRNILSAFHNLMSLKQAGSRTEPEPRIGKNRFFSVNPNRTWTVSIWDHWTWTEPEPLNFGATEPEPILNPNFWKLLNLNRNWTAKN